MALIANVQLVGEGGWFWYAVLARSGLRLYSDLGFSQQPFFVLETEWNQAIFGTSWLASKLPATLHLFAFASGMALLVKRSTWSGVQKAVVLLCSFFAWIRFEAYRFDDYHVVKDVLVLFTAILLLRLCRPARARVRVTFVVALGAFAGLTAVTRINDGAALFAFTALALACILDNHRWVALALLGATAAATATLVISMTHESLVTWATFSVLHVGGLKGGSAQFLADPGNVPRTAWDYLITTQAGLDLLAAFAFALSWTLLIVSPSASSARTTSVKRGIGLAIEAAVLYYLWQRIIDGEFVTTFSAFGILIIYGVVILVAAIALRAATQEHGERRGERSWILFLLPFFIIASGSLSSGGHFNDLNSGPALFVLLLPLVGHVPPRNFRTALVAFLALVALSGMIYRFQDPFSWISFRTYPLFTNRQYIRHPVYGPMILDAHGLQFSNRICALVRDGDPKPELLSMPFPYANYYCAIPPWHGFVQTWFDTTSKAVVDDLTDRLRTDPPKYILYQRQIGILTYHEAIFNGGARGPHRDLDELFMQRVASGQWRIVYREQYGTDSDWMLVRTRWNVSPGANLLKNSSAEDGLARWHVSAATTRWTFDRRRARFRIAATADTQGGSASEATIWHTVRFRRDGATSIRVAVAGQGIVAAAGAGYVVDLYDPEADAVVASLGWSNADEALRSYAFSGTVVANRAYELRLRYLASAGTVTVSIPSVSGATAPRIAARSDAGWTMPSSIPPAWHSDAVDGGRFVVRHSGDGVAESSLCQDIYFDRHGPVAVQLFVGAQALDAGDGYGYVVDVHDAETGTIAGSLGVPAASSTPRHYTFVANVDPHRRYQLRLRYKAASGTVYFSKIKVEYGTIATERSSESLRSLPHRARSTRNYRRSS